MKTIISIVETNLKQQPFLAKMLTDDLINLSSLARRLKPQIDLELQTNVKIGSVVMALKRLIPLLKTQNNINYKKLTNIYGDINIRLNLCIHTYKKSTSLISAHKEFLDKLTGVSNLFHLVSKGIFETSIVLSTEYQTVLDTAFRNENLVLKMNNLSCITIKLGVEYSKIPGVYYLIFSKLAWQNISVHEVFTTTYEITILIDETDTEKAFSCIKDIFIKNPILVS